MKKAANHCSQVNNMRGFVFIEQSFSGLDIPVNKYNIINEHSSYEYMKILQVGIFGTNENPFLSSGFFFGHHGPNRLTYESGPTGNENFSWSHSY